MDVILQPGDIFLSRGTSLLSRAIRVCTRSFGEKRSKVNHVGIVVEAGGIQEAVVVEALSKVKMHTLWKQYGNSCNHTKELLARRCFTPPRCSTWIAVFRAKNVSPEEMGIIVATAKRQVDKTYGYFKIVAHLLDWCFSGIYFFRWFARNSNYPICSWLVAHAYGEADYDFGVPREAANPDDIWDFVNEHPNYYDCIVKLAPM